MGRQLDILALEPYHGGPRRAMLEAISRCSRHRWTLLKLPARKMERRLLVAATWFAEHLSRNEVGRLDLIFTSEALNLADLFRLRPELSRYPAVVYFHDNQLPDPLNGRLDTPTDLVNLNSAMAASEIWFNSLYNLRTFLSRASGLVSRHRELQSRNPMARLTAKAHLVPPPIDMTVLHELASQPPARRNPKSILLDCRGADTDVLVKALTALAKRVKEPISLTLIGRLRGLPAGYLTETLDQADDHAHVQRLLTHAILVTARPGATSDDLVVRALAAKCHPIVADSGVYPELIPESLHRFSLHDNTPDSIVDRLLDVWYLERPAWIDLHLEEKLDQFDALKACKTIDDRLAALTEVHAARV